MLCLMLISSGCRTVVVIPADKAAVAMPAGKPYTPVTDGFFVPQSRMLEILTELEQRP
jgi:hypothetical protein